MHVAAQGSGVNNQRSETVPHHDKNRKFAELVHAGLVSLDEAQTALLKAAGNPPPGSARRCQMISWALRDAITEQKFRPTLGQPPSLPGIDAAIATRHAWRRGHVWGHYCPLYEPDLIELEAAVRNHRP